MAEPLTSEPSGRSEPRIAVALVDRDPASLRVAAAAVAEAGGAVAANLSPQEATARGALSGARLAIVDLPDHAGLDLVARLAAEGVVVVATSGAGSVGLAVEAMRRGAIDFVLKPFSPEALARRLRPRLAELPRAAPEAPSKRTCDFGGFVGASAAMQAVYGQIARIAPSRAPAFVTGESGVGKELCAEAIHARSGRGARPFVALNCGAIPRELMESEVFGHVRGAFTGAGDDREGAVEAAAGGTLFLDEIGEMELGLQAKLLRVLQTGEFRRVGEARARRADIRIVCATHRDPAAEVAAGRFRQDLFYRLHVLPIRIPPLRERGEDVVRLAETFLARFSTEEGRRFEAFAPDVLELFRGHGWPGNVRELQNVIRRAVVLDDASTVTRDMLPQEFCGVPADSAAHEGAEAIEPFDLQERRIIEHAIRVCGGSLARAAAALRISPSTIYRKRERWGGQNAG